MVMFILLGFTSLRKYIFVKASGEEIFLKGKYSLPSRESRSETRGKRRKTNLILNLLIGTVILLIIVVSSVIFFGGNNEETAGKADENKENQIQENESSSDDQSKVDNENTENDDQKTSQTDTDSEDVDKADAEDKSSNSPEKQDPVPANEEDAVVTDGGEGDNVNKTIENSSWQPIGTTQTGEHTSVYDPDSVDWAEMLQAMSYATGISQDNMTVWFLGNNGHNKSVGTISSKGQQEKYRVYIEWVDGQGWKPTKVEQLDKIN